MQAYDTTAIRKQTDAFQPSERNEQRCLQFQIPEGHSDQNYGVLNKRRSLHQPSMIEENEHSTFPASNLGPWHHLKRKVFPANLQFTLKQVERRLNLQATFESKLPPLVFHTAPTTATTWEVAASLDFCSSLASLAVNWASTLPPHHELKPRAYTIITPRANVNDARLPSIIISNELACFNALSK
jgi:hypothetical protein